MDQHRDILNEGLIRGGADFSTHLEARIAEHTGVFEDPHPFMREFFRGLAERIGDHDVVPIGFINATELYIYDCSKTGVNGFTGEPMPASLRDMPPMMYGVARMEADTLAREAFGDDFGNAVRQIYDEITAKAGEQPA